MTQPIRISSNPEGLIVAPIGSFFYRRGEKYFRIHGGGCGYSRPMVDRIVTNRWFTSDTFVNNLQFLDQEDVMLAHVIERERLAWFDHPEFSCGRPITPTTAVAHR